MLVIIYQSMMLINDSNENVVCGCIVGTFLWRIFYSKQEQMNEKNSLWYQWIMYTQYNKTIPTTATCAMMYEISGEFMFDDKTLV